MHYTSLSSLKAYASITQNTDDAVLADEIEWAENVFRHNTGCTFYAQTVQDEFARQPFVDRYGFLWLTSQGAAPVTGVSAISIRDLTRSDRVWRTLSWDPDDLILPAQIADNVTPDAWTVRVYPNNTTLLPCAAGQIQARWTYTAGFTVTPPALEAIINRLAFWHYKMREVPYGRLTTEDMGIVAVPEGVPPDMVESMNHWRRMV